ncbi:MAG: CBS domain-containing protein [Candidatus Lokiarchaeota archaeon]|nr:CBS domain-containing protein [Candidatus Lokiarchaeota archaeon]
MLITKEDLKKLREEANITQLDLAEAVGVTQAYIARMEKGSLDPKLSLVNKIVDYLTKSRTIRCLEIMTANPKTIDARKSVANAIEVMQKYGYSQLPVVRTGRIVGMITERDIIRNLQHDASKISVEAVVETSGPPRIDESTPIDSILPLFDLHQAVLLLNQGRLSGIITRSDLLKLGLS